MRNKMKRMSRENQKLLYWFIECYAYYLASIEINFKSSKDKPLVSDYFKYKAKEDLKKLYIKYSGKNTKEYEPFKNMEEKIEKKIGKVLYLKINKDNKIKLLANMLIELVTEEIQMLFIKLNDTFSLAIKLFSNKEAIDFTNFLFDYFMQHEIPMWEEMQQLYHKQNEDKYVYVKLKYKRCAICNKGSVDLHHWDNVSSIGGYEYDDGMKTRFMSLCREHHNEFHNIGEKAFEEKYKIRGIYLSEKNVVELLKIYPGHFKAFKKKIREK